MRASNFNFSSRAVSPRRQQGVVLIITLIVLIAMTLATIALVRSVDTSNVIVGNLAFKQGATQAGDAGTEAAAAWLNTRAGTPSSYNNDAANGYYATGLDVDMTGNGTDPNRYVVDWDANACDGTGVTASHCLSPAPAALNAGSGNTVQYIIDRLCLNAGQGPGIQGNCPTIYSNIPGLSQGDDKYQPPPETGTWVEYYRITSRIKGPRNTVSYVETIVHY